MAEMVLETIQTGEHVRDKIVLGLNVSEVGAAMQRFGWLDYVMFIIMLLLCVFIGLYFAIFKKSENSQDYLMGGRNMAVIPVALSLIASFISGISLLGIPTEVYVYGIQYLYILGGVILTGLVFRSLYLPIFHELKLTSTYEYHQKRFDRRVRLFASILFTISTFVWLPLVIYVPALALNQVTGVNVHYITPLVCVICIFYTSIGGLKAVIWTDVIQSAIMVAVMFLIVIKASLDTGGFLVVWERNWSSSRIEAPNFDWNPSSRHTFWSLVVGGSIHFLQSGAVNQNMIQRYLSLPTLKAANRALWIYTVGLFIINGVCAYAGLVIYAIFYKCDPLSTMLAKEKDQLLPLLVMETLGKLPGLPGLFLAGIFSAALSSLSTGLNSMAAVVLEDFYKPFFSRTLTERQANILMKMTIIIFGGICVALVFIVEKLGAVLQLTTSLGAVAHGPSLGLFTLGMLLPWANANGALVGGTSGLVFMSWLCLRAQTAIVSGDLSFPEKPVTTEGCHYHFTPKNSSYTAALDFHFDPSLHTINVTHTDEAFMLYRLSYLWYTCIGALVTLTVGLVTSLCSHPNDPRDVDIRLLFPFIRKFIKPRKYPNEPSEGIIYAYNSKNADQNGSNNVVLDSL